MEYHLKDLQSIAYLIDLIYAKLVVDDGQTVLCSKGIESHIFGWSRYDLNPLSSEAVV